MRIIFMGSPGFAVPFLHQLVIDKHDIVGVFCAPLAVRGRRGKQEEHCEVGKYATEHNLPLFTPKSLKKSDIQEQIINLKADLIIVVAYGAIIPEKLLTVAKHGCINVHGSLLPRWRGAAPIERAIEAGDYDTGVCIMQMEAGLDTGPVALREAVPIAGLNSGELRNLLAKIGVPLLVQAIRQLEQGTLTFIPQEGETCYAQKITKEETKIDWSLPAEVIERKIRALAPAPGAWCEMKLNSAAQPCRVKILAAEVSNHGNELAKLCCDNKYINITLCQKAGGKVVSAEQFVIGHKHIEIV